MHAQGQQWGRWSELGGDKDIRAPESCQWRRSTMAHRISEAKSSFHVK